MKENRQDNGGQLPNKYGGPRGGEEQGRLRFPEERRMEMHVQGAGVGMSLRLAPVQWQLRHSLSPTRVSPADARCTRQGQIINEQLLGHESESHLSPHPATRCHAAHASTWLWQVGVPPALHSRKFHGSAVVGPCLSHLEPLVWCLSQSTDRTVMVVRTFTPPP